MRGQFDSGKDGCRSVSSTYNTQRSGFLRSETQKQGHQQDCENTELCGCTEDGKFKIAKHRPEISEGSHTHKDDRRKKSRLDQTIIQIVHYSELVSYLVHWHLPDGAQRAITQSHHTGSVGLDNPHLPAREIGNQHPESYRDEQQRLIFFHDAQIEQAEGDQIHQQISRLINDVTDGCHLVKFIENVSHNYLSLVILTITSSSSTLSPLEARISVMTPSKSAQIALLIFIASI